MLSTETARHLIQTTQPPVLYDISCSSVLLLLSSTPTPCPLFCYYCC